MGRPGRGFMARLSCGHLAVWSRALSYQRFTEQGNELSMTLSLVCMISLAALHFISNFLYRVSVAHLQWSQPFITFGLPGLLQCNLIV